MGDEASILLRVLQSVFAIYGFFYIAVSILFPKWFLNNISIEQARARNRFRNPDLMTLNDPWYAMPIAFVTLVAIGVVIYSASYGLVAAIPYSWGNANEDGEWESLRRSLQFSVAFVGSIVLTPRVKANAEILVWGPVEREARWALTDSISKLRFSSPEAITAISDSVEQKLKVDSTNKFCYQFGYLNSLKRDIFAKFGNQN